MRSVTTARPSPFDSTGAGSLVAGGPGPARSAGRRAYLPKHLVADVDGALQAVRTVASGGGVRAVLIGLAAQGTEP